MQQSFFTFDVDTSLWESSADKDLVASIKASPWKVCDVETTQLTPYSKPLQPHNPAENTKPRLRVLSIAYKDLQSNSIKNVGFDFDIEMRERGPEKVRELCSAAMTGVVIGHNVGFDLYWLFEHTKTEPDLVLDTMLLARTLRHRFPLEVAEIANLRANEPHHFKEQAKQIFSREAGMWTLETLAAVILGIPLDKKYQKPRNWITPVLTEEHFKYATGDTKVTLSLLATLLNSNELDWHQDYLDLREETPALKLIEPQVSDVVELRRKGIPISKKDAILYADSAFKKAAAKVAEMLALEPDLKPFKELLSDPDKGLTSDLKQTLADCFLKKGITLRTTAKTGEYKIGEKDLRLAGAEHIEEAIPLFNAWVAVAKNKKSGKMALEVLGFRERGSDKKAHPLLSHGPVTGRLSSAEPNSQQFPGAQEFRNIVRAWKGRKIAACDYSALDMRVGSALCIRAQLEIKARHKTGTLPQLIEEKVNLAKCTSAKELEAILNERMADRLRFANEALDQRNWEVRNNILKAIKLDSFAWRLAFVWEHAEKEGEESWSALRDAFKLDLDIHTYTALKFNGENPAAMFKGLSKHAVEKLQKQKKEEIGGKRKAGKVGNLGLLYAMQDYGFTDYANKTFNMGWSLEYGAQIRKQWFEAYPEVALWHLWTDLTSEGEVWLPQKGNIHAKKPQDVHEVETLGGRQLIAFGLNAALSYPDQGTGADIVGTAFHEIRENHEEVFECLINQVHDEIVAEFPENKAAEYSEILEQAMTDAGNKFTMPFGVPIAADTVIGDVWLKD